MENQTTTNVLLQNFTTFLGEIGSLLFITLIDVLHDRVRTTFGGHPNMFGSFTIDFPQNSPNPSIGS